MKLDDRFTFRPPGVFHSGGPVTKRACRKFFCTGPIERFSSRELKSTGNHGDSLCLWVGMRWDMVAVRKLKAHHERTFFRWIAFQHSHLRPGRQNRWSLLPFDSRWRIKAHV